MNCAPERYHEDHTRIGSVGSRADRDDPARWVWSPIVAFGTMGTMDTGERPPGFRALDVDGMVFHPVIDMPSGYEVYDFTGGYDPDRPRTSDYGVGRYDEDRPGMYLGEQFVGGQRTVHVGVDLAAPVGEPVHAFYEGTIFQLGDNARAYDYGPTIITHHRWGGQDVYALHGHVTRCSLARWQPGDSFAQGERLARVGARDENGGWNPHLHFQLSLIRPTTHDLPGVVSRVDRAWALEVFPDPRLVLGPLY